MAKSQQSLCGLKKNTKSVRIWCFVFVYHIIGDAQNKNEKVVQIFEYNDAIDSWTKKSDFPGSGRLEGTVFSFKDKIYYGLGRNSSPVKGLSDIWEYSPSTNSWKFVGNYPGGGNVKVVAADMGDYALLFCGYQVRESNAGTEKYFNSNDTWKFIID